MNSSLIKSSGIIAIGSSNFMFTNSKSVFVLTTGDDGDGDGSGSGVTSVSCGGKGGTITDCRTGTCAAAAGTDSGVNDGTVDLSTITVVFSFFCTSDEDR